MADQAKVLSVQALKDFRIALINFVEEARNALGGVDMELRRTRDWLERDPDYDSLRGDPRFQKLVKTFK